nr:cobalamin-dependent protein [uncultured Sphingorhabdus sp.]
MATVFGLSGLKSKLDDWRGNRKNAEVPNVADASTGTNNIRLVASRAEHYDLSLLLENLVIPKLIADRNHSGAAADPVEIPGAAVYSETHKIAATDVEAFTIMSLHEEAHVLLSFVDDCLASGNSVETVFVELLAPAARRLGEYWTADSEDFVGVTMGLWRIQEVLRELTLRIPPAARPGNGQRSALFSPMPGEQHSFGTLMVAECFQRAGWDTDVLIEPTRSELTGKFAKRHYDLIGLTVSNDCSTSALSSLVTTIKAVSSNPHIKVLLGGRVINEQPELVRECGADATAHDAVSAVEAADHMVPLNITCFENLT